MYSLLSSEGFLRIRWPGFCVKIRLHFFHVSLVIEYFIGIWKEFHNGIERERAKLKELITL